MTKLERVLEPNSAEMPTCICGEDMELRTIEPLAMMPDKAESREFGCICGHRMRLAIWKN